MDVEEGENKSFEIDTSNERREETHERDGRAPLNGPESRNATDGSGEPEDLGKSKLTLSFDLI